MYWRRPEILPLAKKMVLALLAAIIAVLILYRFLNPPYSALMLSYIVTGKPVTQRWVPIDQISPQLVSAVVTSEDARFCRHWGVDWVEMKNAIKRAEKRGEGPRGASTIPMQTVKNLFLWQSRSYLRKAIEIPLTYMASFFWPKKRMLEIYLNVAEWAPGIFGAQAAAKHHFRTSAAKLTRAQAAQMAAALPNPHVRNAGRPGPRTRALARRMTKRLQKGGAPLDCIYPN